MYIEEIFGHFSIHVLTNKGDGDVSVSYLLAVHGKVFE